MFQRRQRLPLHFRMTQWIWPRMGWKRTGLYYWHRLQRIPGTPESVAAGFACGAAISMTPFYGTHIVTAGLVAWALRANLLAAVVGAQLANPWTAPPLWYAAYYIGALMAGIDVAGHPPAFVEMFKGLTEAALQLDKVMFRDRVWPIFWPMLIGSIPMGIVTGVVSYYSLLPALKAVQARRILRMQKRAGVAHAPYPPAGADV